MATSGFAAGIRRQRLGHRGGLTHHLDVLTGFEQGAQARADDLVVVEEEHAKWHGRYLRIPAKGLPFGRETRGPASISSPGAAPSSTTRRTAPGTGRRPSPNPRMEGADQ